MITPSSAVQLQVATNILNGSLPLTGVAPARAGAWVARSALELLVDELLAQRSVDPGRGTMRSRLICLGIAFGDDPERVATIAHAWDQLSQACHHHAYELVPSHQQVSGLVLRLSNFATSVAETCLPADRDQKQSEGEGS